MRTSIFEISQSPADKRRTKEQKSGWALAPTTLENKKAYMLPNTCWLNNTYAEPIFHLNELALIYSQDLWIYSTPSELHHARSR